MRKCEAATSERCFSHRPVFDTRLPERPFPDSSVLPATEVRYRSIRNNMTSKTSMPPPIYMSTPLALTFHAHAHENRPQ